MKSEFFKGSSVVLCNLLSSIGQNQFFKHNLEGSIVKGSIVIPIPSASQKAKNRGEKEYGIYRAQIEVDQVYEQLVISFYGNKIKWFTCIVYDQNDEIRGQVVQTNKKPLERLFIGREEQFNSATSKPGLIAPGVWKLEFEILHNPQEAIQVEVKYELRKKGEVANDYLPQQQNIYKHPPLQKTQKRWYKGDFHTHTHYSDGAMTRERNLEMAAQQKLDFFVATEHNITPHFWPKNEAVVPFPGVELTTPKGHANFLFIHRPIFSNCSLSDMYSEKGVSKIIERNQDNGLFSINHPFLKPWAWELHETKIEVIDSLELCNDPTYIDNPQATEQALSFWSFLLNEGYRITGIGGSDSHILPEEKYPYASEPSLIGDPATYVYAESLTAEALKDGIRSGHVIISRDGFIDIQVKGESLLPGDPLTKSSGELTVQLERGEDSLIQWVVDGQIVQIDYGKESTYIYHFAENSYHWVRADVRDRKNRFIGTTNPFYWGTKQPQLITWGEAVYEWNRQ